MLGLLYRITIRRKHFYKLHYVILEARRTDVLRGQLVTTIKWAFIIRHFAQSPLRGASHRLAASSIGWMRNSIHFKHRNFERFHLRISRVLWRGHRTPSNGGIGGRRRGGCPSEVTGGDLSMVIYHRQTIFNAPVVFALFHIRDLDRVSLVRPVDRPSPADQRIPNPG